MTWVSTAEEGVVWGIDEEHDIWIYRDGDISIEEFTTNDEHGWTHVEGKLKQLEVSRYGWVVGVNEGGNIYWREGITKETAIGTNWA